VLSHGLLRRLAGAYYATGAAIVIGITASLLKGFDYEEATLLALVLMGLWQARPAFSRHAAFRDARLSPAWIAAALGALAASIWLGLFAYEHVQYANDLWWQFELQGDAPRFLRASVGAAVVVALFGLSRLVGPARYGSRRPAPGIGATSSKPSPRRRSPAPISCSSVTRESYSTMTGARSSCMAFTGAAGSRLATRSGRTRAAPQRRASSSSDATISGAFRCFTKCRLGTSIGTSISD
jgi:hypothetical protein